MENKMDNRAEAAGSPELQAAFRLGQMDMQESVLLMLKDMAEKTTTAAGKHLIEAIAGCVNRLEVMHAE